MALKGLLQKREMSRLMNALKHAKIQFETKLQTCWRAMGVFIVEAFKRMYGLNAGSNGHG